MNATAEPQSTPNSVAAPSTPNRRKQVFLALKLLIGLLVIAAPALAASPFIPGVTGVAFYGVLAASFGWMASGPKGGIGVSASLAALGAISIAFAGATWFLALLLLALGVAYGYAASRGFGAAVVQLPILTPYFMMRPPALFTDPPVIGPMYLGGVVAIILLMGLWTTLILHLAMGKPPVKHEVVSDSRMAIVYGTILGVLATIIMLIGTGTELKSHWVWVTLTLYLLADPNQLVAPKKIAGRAIGTALGVVVVGALVLTPLSDTALQILALPALWLCILWMQLPKPYWQYTLFLTVTVVLMNSAGVNTLLLDLERIGFTLIGIALSVLAALLVNLLYYRRRGLSAPAPARAE